MKQSTQYCEGHPKIWQSLAWDSDDESMSPLQHCSLLGRVLLIQARFVEHLIWLEYFWITPYLVLSDYHLYTKSVETSR